MRNTVNPKFDEKKWKPIIVGTIVFIVVFAGLTAYQKTAEKNHEDEIVRDEITESIDESTIIDEEEENSVVQDTIFVDVGGAVNLSGLFALPAGSRIADAIEAAGGLTEEADIKYINRAYVLADGDRLYIPSASEVQSGTAPPSAGQVDTAAGVFSSNTQNDSADNLININTAGSDELQKLNGVGPATAQKIIDYRTKRGGFKRIEDLMNVSGIGAKTFEKLRDYISV